MSDGPLVSLILCVKNGMPYLPEALASVARQTYGRFELVVQDGRSTDGSLDVLAEWSARLPIALESRADGGATPAFVRAFHRSRGDVVGSIDCDNLLEPHALEVVVRRFAERPDAAAIYGGAHMIEASGARRCTWHPEDHDFLRAMCCEMVPPFGTAFFDRRLCAAELGRERSTATCGDYDLWLRIGHLPILRVPDVLGSTRLSASSITCRPETYERMCADKIAALTTFLAEQPPGVALPCLTRHATAGIYLWAAESLLGIEGRGERFARVCRLAAEQDPGSPRLRRLLGDDTAPLAIAADASRTVLIDGEAETLARLLEVNVYGEPRAAAATLHAGTVVLRPTTERDHLATPFVAVPRRGAPAIPRVLEVELGWDDAVALANADVVVQDRRCRTLGTVAAAAGRDAATQTLPLAAEIDAVRLVFSGPVDVTSRLPRRVRVAAA